MTKKCIYPVLTVVILILFGTFQEQIKGATPFIQVAEEERIDQAHWSYEGETGPEHWGDLDPSFIACKNGKQQSPINIEFSKVKKSDQAKNIQLHYGQTLLSLTNNGHSIQANMSGPSNKLVIDGKEYKLAQFHFHTPSEHQIHGQNYDMEVHFVHQDANGNYAVLGLMIKEGIENKTLAPLWRVLPKEKTAEAIPIKESVDLRALQPADHKLFYYKGSLTTPPCTEVVEWVVLKKSIEMSIEQIQAFKQIFHKNNRPVQPLNNRDILLGTFVEN